jgi:hypothetical protein
MTLDEWDEILKEDPSYQECINEIYKFFKLYESQLKFIGEGRNRICYLHKGYVIKLPKNIEGLFDNSYESRSFLIKDYPKARCKLLKQSILVMEYVRDYYDCGLESSNLPDWAGFVDCMQVGLNKKNELVAYDYGRN